MFFLVLFSLLISLSVGRGMAMPEPTTLTIKEAVEIAVRNKPNLQAYKYAIEMAKTRGMQALSLYLPQVDLTARVGETIGDKSPQTRINLETRQLVYSFAGPIQQYKKAKKLTKIQELSYDQTKKEIKYYVEQAFLDCWKLQQFNQSILAFDKSNESTYERAKHENKLKLTNKSNWLASDAEHIDGVMTVDNYYQDLALAQKKLEFFMGQPIDLSLKNIKAPRTNVLTLALEWQEPKEFNVETLPTYYKYAMKNREALKIADKKIGVAKEEVSIQARSNLPTLSLYGSVGYQSVASTVVGQELASLGKVAPRNRYTLQAVVTWPIFNGALNDYREKEAHAEMLKEILMKEQVSQDVRLAVDQAYTALNQAINDIKAQKSKLVFAKNDLALKQQQFDIGQISKIELDTAVTAWEKAHYAWLEKQIEATKQERSLAYACGYPQELFD